MLRTRSRSLRGEFRQDLIDLLRHGPSGLVGDVPSPIDDVDHVGETAVLPVDSLVHPVDEDWTGDVLLCNQLPGIAELLLEVLVLAVLPVGTLARVGLPNVDR